MRKKNTIAIKRNFLRTCLFSDIELFVHEIFLNADFCTRLNETITETFFSTLFL